jgi:hypothetical protein
MNVGHLVRRFIGSWWATAPSPADEAWVDQQLTKGERRCWVQMSDADRAHSLLVARRFVSLVPDAPRSAVAAALLHDVGKLASGLGTFGRVAATVVGGRGVRFRTYHDHERIGASMLRTAGSDPLTVALVAGDVTAPEQLRAALAQADTV